MGLRLVAIFCIPGVFHKTVSSYCREAESCAILLSGVSNFLFYLPLVRVGLILLMVIGLQILQNNKEDYFICLSCFMSA